jgi:tetratricopeptide (TPR) repeat protein
MTPGSPTDPDRWRRIEAVLDQVLDLAADERGALLDQACREDPDLRAEVEALLAADERAAGFLDTPAAERDADLLAEGLRDEEEEGEEGEEHEEEEALAGRRVGPYLLLREVGRGGMGTVYEAEDERLGRRVAVKLLPPEVSRDRQAKKRFLREARAASAVDHPNLCTVHDVGESDGRLYIVLSFYEGETLRERLRRGPLPIAQAREVAVQVAQGLARAHESGIVHRDIKPANVMLTRRGEVKILDFGIARLQGDGASLTHTGASWGTPAYMSPEQARGEPVDGRTDVWALGVLLYEMIAGRRPFGGDSVEALISSVLTREPEPLDRVRPEVPPELARIAARALAKDPSRRPASALELLVDLKAPAPAARRALRGRPAVWRGLAAGGLAILLLLAFLWTSGHLLGPPTVRVAVLSPSEEDPELAAVASEVTEAVLATLASLEGLQPLDPPDREEGAEVERQRAKEADEVLLPLLDCERDWCRLTLRRLRGPGGVVLATAGPFEVPAGIENAHQLAEGVRAHLQEVYPRHRRRPDAPGQGVRPEDYSAYIEIERQVDAGRRVGAEALGRLDALLRTSPDLVGASLLAAGIARNAGENDRALAYATRAEEIAPSDPRPLFVRLRVEVEGRRLDEAQATLAKLRERAPADARVQSAEADLLEARGELEAALRLRQKVAERRPTWRMVLDLATLELRLGASASARAHLLEILKGQPDNQYALENLAALEVGSGDLRRAAALYEQLIRVQPTRSSFTNLGFVHFLAGDYGAAAAAYRRALELEPGHLLSRFNLATALEAQGDPDGALPIYRTLERELAAASSPPDDRTRMLHAQCLARLGEREAALRLTEEVLKKRPEDFQVLHQAAQLFALLGERLAALYYTEMAMKKNLRREWFTIPEFRSLEKDPEFRALLDSRS